MDTPLLILCLIARHHATEAGLGVRNEAGIDREAPGDTAMTGSGVVREVDPGECARGPDLEQGPGHRREQGIVILKEYLDVVVVAGVGVEVVVVVIQGGIGIEKAVEVEVIAQVQKVVYRNQLSRGL